MWNLKYDTNEPMKQNRKHREQTGCCRKGTSWDRARVGLADINFCI